MSNRTKIVALIVILVLGLSLIVGLTISRNNSLNNNAPEQSEVNKTVSFVVILDSGNLSYSLPFVENEKLFATLKRLDETNDRFSFQYQASDYGPYLTQINTITYDANKQFWKIMINGKDSDVGIGDYTVKVNDNISFVLEDIKF